MIKEIEEEKSEEKMSDKSMDSPVSFVEKESDEEEVEAMKSPVSFVDRGSDDEQEEIGEVKSPVSLVKNVPVGKIDEGEEDKKVDKGKVNLDQTFSSLEKTDSDEENLPAAGSNKSDDKDEIEEKVIG